MKSIKPQPHQNARLVTFGNDQPEYADLSASVDDLGVVMTEWEPTENELRRLLCGGKVRLWIETFDAQIGEVGHALQPICVEVVDPPPVVVES